MVVKKKVIGIICDSKELFLSLKRALALSFPAVIFYFYDTGLAEKDSFDKVETPIFKEEGVLIAFLPYDEENLRVCRFVKYLRIKRGLRFPLIFCSFISGETLQGDYDVLTYGRKSHSYCPIPIELSMLVETISSVDTMSDGNYRLFFRQYSGKHREYYEKEVLPLLAQFNDIEREDFIEKLEGLIYELISNTPLTCHKEIWYNGGKRTLSWHLYSEMDRLKSFNETLQTENLAGIRELLNQWYKLVMDKTFE